MLRPWVEVLERSWGIVFLQTALVSGKVTKYQAVRSIRPIISFSARELFFVFTRA
jgi:hypothetical protein